jgi:hypothetical protein
MRQAMKVVFAIMSLIIGATAAHAERLIINSPVSSDHRFYATADVTQCIPYGGNFSAYFDGKGVIEMVGERRDIVVFQNCVTAVGANLPTGTPRNGAISAR